MYTLSDCEEDVEDNPGKGFPSSSCIYTYTNSTVLHPDDGTSVISSRAGSQVASRITSRSVSRNVSRQTSAPMTPRASLSRRNSCSTFSVSLGLASMLNERGIKAVTPSAFNTPHGVNFSPTVTPCNSPEGMTPRESSPEPQFLTGLLTSGADLLRRKLIGEHQVQKIQRSGNKIMLSRLEKRALKSIKILEKVEYMGLESIGSSNSSTASGASSSSCHQLPMHGASGLYCGNRSSPMAQLTSLKKLGNTNDEVKFNRESIKAVLSKGLSFDSTKSNISSDSDQLSDTSIMSKPPKVGGGVNQPSTSSSSTSTTTPKNSRLVSMQRQKSRRQLKNGQGGQRQDLGTVGGSTNNLLSNNNSLSNKPVEQKTDTQSIGFIGTISSLLFGRKGGLL